MTRVLGLDLAQRCGWAWLECADEQVVASSGVLDLTPSGATYDRTRNVPNGNLVGKWLLDAQVRVRELVMSVNPELVVVETPDNFMLGYRVGKGGQMRRASDPRTIESMLRLSAVTLAAVVEAGALPFSGMRVECVSPNEWQDSMFHNVPVRMTPGQNGITTKDISKSAAKLHLGFESDDHNKTDAALMALYIWRRDRNGKAEQMKMVVKNAKFRC
jgi:hypothetical protein